MTLTHTKRRPVPSISCDLYNAYAKFEVTTSKRFRRRYNYKKRDGRTDVRTDRLWYEFNLSYFSNEKVGIMKMSKMIKKSSPPARPSYMPAGAFCGNTVKSRKFEVLGTSGFYLVSVVRKIGR